ncbi:MAG: class I SAM-dependent methyltransferase [Armatimonadetes bacterium]|nr:class I SAM-dependent methyltransferase [Armatimonadota bacterium]
MDGPYAKWNASASAWIARQGSEGDPARRDILDPAIDGLLGDVRGLRVLDVGCGEGRYGRKLARLGAQVVGIDPVLPFLQQGLCLAPGSWLAQADGARLPVASGKFDVVLAYLSLLDIAAYRAAAEEMVRACRPGGRIILVMVSNMASTTDGWIKDQHGVKLHRAVDNYMTEFSLALEWAGISIDNYHRPLSALLRPFFKAGCVLTALEEPLPHSDHPDFRDEFRCPTFQIYVLQRLTEPSGHC